MAKIDFFHNENLCIGVEIEVQLVDPATGDLKPVGPAILKDLKDDLKAFHIKSEIFQSMLEIETPICENAVRAGASLRASLKLLREAASENGAQIIMAGTHPFAHYAERLLTPDSRYYALVDRNKWITRRLQIFGLHVHLGMRDGEHAIAMNNALSHYLPVVLALSASSPYWHGEDTELASSRITFFEAIPTGGHPYQLSSWKDYEGLVERLLHSKSISSTRDLWWDIRPNAEYGTIEIRIADCPPTVREVEAIVALIHSLAVKIDGDLKSGRNIPGPSEWIVRENKWRASRYGVQCDLIKDPLGTSVPFLSVWQELRASLDPVIRSFKYGAFFEFLDEMVLKGPSYVRQRRHYGEGFQEIIRHLIRENEDDRPEWSSAPVVSPAKRI